MVVARGQESKVVGGIEYLFRGNPTAKKSTFHKHILALNEIMWNLTQMQHAGMKQANITGFFKESVNNVESKTYSQGENKDLPNLWSKICLSDDLTPFLFFFFLTNWDLSFLLFSSCPLPYLLVGLSTCGTVNFRQYSRRQCTLYRRLQCRSLALDHGRWSSANRTTFYNPLQVIIFTPNPFQSFPTVYKGMYQRLIFGWVLSFQKSSFQITQTDLMGSRSR